MAQQKTRFGDGIAFHYSWDPMKMPSLHPWCENFTVAYALHCPKVWYTQTRDNEIRNAFADLLSGVFYDVNIETHFQPLQGGILCS